MKALYTAALVASLILLAGCSSTQAPSTMTIGWMGPLTGDAASYGESIQRGIELAQAEYPGIEIIYEDSQCDATQAANSATKLISIDNVEAIIGEVCSGATIAAAPIAKQNNVVMISSSSTSPELTNNEYIFRTIPSDALQGAFGAQLVTEDGNNRLAVLYGNEEYGIGFTDVLVREFDGEIVATEAFERGSVDMRTQLTKIQAQEPDALFLITNSPDSASAVLRQAQELGLEVDTYGSEGLKSQDILDGAGEAANGLIVTSVSSGSEEFADKHQETFGEEPGPFAAQAYDAYIALHTVMVKQEASDIREALTQVSFQGVSGYIDFDENGDVPGNYEVFVAQDATFVKR